MLKSYFSMDLVEAGCDETGRGCIAGPVVAAAVILPRDYQNEELDDSKKLSRKKQAAEKAWLRDELWRLEACDVSHEKAITLQARLLRHHGEWLVFLDDPRVPPTNNLAERALRPLVVLRKITFGSRSDAGAKRMAQIMTVGETVRRHGHRASDIYFELYTRPPDRVLRRLYAGA